MSENNYTTKIKEQCSDFEPSEIEVNILCENGQIWIQPEGYGEKCTMDGHGYPIGLEIWQGKLRLIIFDDINIEDAKIIELENARESRRREYCQAAEYLAEQGRRIFTDSMIGGLWNAACLSAGILSNEQGDKAAYEYLLNFSDKYLQDISNDKKRLWQQVMANAVTLLKITEPSEVVKKTQ